MSVVGDVTYVATWGMVTNNDGLVKVGHSVFSAGG